MADLKWEDPRASKFVTNAGLITSRGSMGDNIMSCEWTHQISYSPGIIAVCINKANQATAKNIEESVEFIVNLASVDHNIVASIAGNNHGNELDKISLLKEMGYKFTEGNKVKALVVEGASLVAECRVKEVIDMDGSHTIYIGDIVELHEENGKDSLIYYKRKFWHADNQIHKPEQEILDKIDSLKTKFKK